MLDRHVERLVASGHERERFKLAAADDELPEMWADPDRLDQILANLIENAVRHGDGTVTVTLESPAARPSGDAPRPSP